jgi:8-oxo-dGTP diphosphatase
VAHLEQLGTWGDPDRLPGAREIATAFVGLVPLGIDPSLPSDTRWYPVDALPRTAFDHGGIVAAGRERLRAKVSYSNAAFALAPPRFTLAELRLVYVAALGYEVSATNLRRVLERRDVIVPTGERRAPGRSGGRPAEVFRFRATTLSITDPFATLRPPD